MCGAGGIHADAEGDEEDGDEEVQQGVDAASEVVVVWELGEAEAGEEGADFERKAEGMCGED